MAINCLLSCVKLMPFFIDNFSRSRSANRKHSSCASKSQSWAFMAQNDCFHIFGTRNGSRSKINCVAYFTRLEYGELVIWTNTSITVHRSIHRERQQLFDWIAANQFVSLIKGMSSKLVMNRWIRLHSYAHIPNKSWAVIPQPQVYRIHVKRKYLYQIS